MRTKNELGIEETIVFYLGGQMASYFRTLCCVIGQNPLEFVHVFQD